VVLLLQRQNAVEVRCNGGLRNCSASYIAPIALAFFCLRFRFAAAVRGQRAAHFYFLFELSSLIAADETAVALVWRDDGSFTRLGFPFSRHDFSFNEDRISPVCVRFYF
jgi:hypothetical protein